MSGNQPVASIGFSERMAANMKLKTYIKANFPGLSATELAARASSAEEDIFNRATSPDNYQALCDQAYSNASSKRSAELGVSASSSPPNRPEVENTNPVEKIGRYEGQYHASGLFSAVYRAMDPVSDQVLAVKVTTPHRMSPPHDSEREARLLTLSSSSSNVIPLLSSEWVAGGHFLLVLPFLPSDLGQLLDGKSLTEHQQKIHLRGLFNALDHIHGLGIIHRDIKPSNLLSQGPDGPVYLADFGIAWQSKDLSSEPADEKITDVGTTCYRAPELLFGDQAYTIKLDMWAAGCVVAECLRNGKSLFDAGDLGSELALLRNMFTTLGTPTIETWPEASRLPDWGKMQFTEYLAKNWKDILPSATSAAIDLVSRLVRFESTDRSSAAAVLEHSFWDT